MIPEAAVEAAVKAWDHHWGDRYGDEAMEEMGEEVRIALAAADAVMFNDAAVERAVTKLQECLTDRDEYSGCALRCGYNGDDRAEHLVRAIIAALRDAK